MITIIHMNRIIACPRITGNAIVGVVMIMKMRLGDCLIMCGDLFFCTDSSKYDATILLVLDQYELYRINWIPPIHIVTLVNLF